MRLKKGGVLYGLIISVSFVNLILSNNIRIIGVKVCSILVKEVNKEMNLS